jgi:hypothetical protein
VFLGAPKRPNTKSILKDCDLDIFIGLNIRESSVVDVYKQSGSDVDLTLDTIIDSF